MATITITKKEYEELKTMVGKIPKVAKEVIQHIEEKEKLQKDLEYAKQGIKWLAEVNEKGEEKINKLKEELAETEKILVERDIEHDIQLKKEREEYQILADWKSKMEENGYGMCAECERIIDGETEGWHQHSKHGYLSVCEGCSNCDSEDEEYDCETCGKKVEGESYGLSYGVMSVALCKDCYEKEKEKDDVESEVEYDCGCCYAERQNSYIMGNDDLDEEHYICEKCFEDFCSKEQHPKYNGKNGWCYLMDKDN